MEKMQQLRELEDTKHEEAMSHIESMAYEEIMTADQSNMLKDQELSKFISMKKQELKTAKLTTQQRIALEKQITEAERAGINSFQEPAGRSGPAEEIHHAV